ncbi:MAG: HAMP domain-containing sensor histidine kinase [Candidatus Latescibacterota bacterium]
MEFDRVPVCVLFDKVLSIFRPQAEARGVEIAASALDVLEAWADANKVTWVLTNLVSNALRYAGAGGHIGLSARRLDDLLHVSVQDDGPGIPPEHQARIFEKFVQLGRERGGGGSGLGLAICRELIRAHSGAIWVESAPGQGSTFTFTLPVVGRGKEPSEHA